MGYLFKWALMMKICILGLLVLGCVHGAPVKEDLKPQSCDDPHAVKAAHVALTKINMERNDGYIFSLHRLSNVHHSMHGENGVVYYLTMDVVETNCSVLSRKDWKHCEAPIVIFFNSEREKWFTSTL
uniref:Fetuin B n=1 Tax=Oryzias latipes TaxID=8090 RepID=A0A3P9LRJ2_ORYLA